MKRFIKFSLTLTTATALSLPIIGLAAQDGDPVVPSTGTIEITADIPHQVLLKNVADITFTQADFIANQSQSGGGLIKIDTVCVYSNAGGYTVTAIGSGTTNAFTLANGANTLPYAIHWVPVTSGGTPVPLTSGAESQNFSNVSTNSDCFGDNARYQIGISKTIYDQLPAGVYEGTLQLIINPPAAEEL